MVEKRTYRVDDEFVAFMDQLAKSGKSNRNKLITDWLAFLNADDQARLINKLKHRGIEYIPNENRRFFEV
mgnify:CR=1 FL=1